MSAKNKVAFLLLLVGIVIAAFTFFSKSETNSDRTGHLDPQDHQVPPQMIADYVNLADSYDALALFVVADEL